MNYTSTANSWAASATSAAVLTQDAQQQLQRIELLVKIGQYDNARMQLREGSFKSLRMDLAFGQEMYRIVKPEVTLSGADSLQHCKETCLHSCCTDLICVTHVTCCMYYFHQDYAGAMAVRLAAASTMVMGYQAYVTQCLPTCHLLPWQDSDRQEAGCLKQSH